MYEVVANKTGVCALVHTRKEAQEVKENMELAHRNRLAKFRPKFTIRTSSKTRGNPIYEAARKRLSS